MFGLLISMASLPKIHPAVVHGHEDPGDPGGVGQMVDGNGIIRVVRVTVTPAGDKLQSEEIGRTARPRADRSGRLRG